MSIDPIEDKLRKAAPDAPTWSVLVLGTLAAVVSSVVTFYIAVNRIERLNWIQSQADWGFPKGYMLAFMFEYVMMPILFGAVLMVVLPFLYAWRKSAKMALPIPGTILGLVIMEAGAIAAMLFGMENFLDLFTLNLVLAALCTSLSVFIILRIANSYP